jgi:hypothetical protein
MVCYGRFPTCHISRSVVAFVWSGQGQGHDYDIRRFWIARQGSCNLLLT